MMSVKKFSISLPEETITQLAWLRENVLYAPASASFSGLIQMAIGIAYFYEWYHYSNDVRARD